MNTSLIGYVLLALLSFCFISLAAIALWPIIDLILEGAKLVGLLLAGGK